MPILDALNPAAFAAKSLMQSLEWLYDRVAAATALDPSEPGAASPPTSLDEAAIDRLVRWAVLQSATTGFVTNLGGAFTLPVALPANLVGVAALQLRLITRIAAARGYDVASEEVRTLAILCLCGNGALEILKEAGVAAGTRLATRLLARINAAAGTRLAARTGTLGAVNLARFVPLAGGLVGGALDGIGTRAVAAVARRVFVRRDPPPAPNPAPALIAAPQPTA